MDTATRFTVWGQAWLLLLIQAGAIEILTFTTLLIRALGSRSPLELKAATGESRTAVVRHVRHRHLLRTLVTVTLVLEAIGAVLLWLMWRDDFGAAGAVWPAVFHAVSAFCNSGFSIFSESLDLARTSPGVLGVVSLLIVTGGLGFIVVEDLRATFVRRVSRRLSVHTRLVLWSSAVLLVAGWILFGLFEWNGALADLGVVDRIANAGFMSVTPRTAGFHTVDYAELSGASTALTLSLMLVGGSPGSTAGGFKTVTFAVLVLLLVSQLRGRERIFLFHRTIPTETVRRAAALLTAGALVLALSVGLLTLTDGTAALGARGGGAGSVGGVGLTALVFEAVSAFGTVGLSMGATEELSAGGRLVVTGLMFVGRVGPPALVAVMARAVHRTRDAYRYGEEDVIVG